MTYTFELWTKLTDIMNFAGQILDHMSQIPQSQWLLILREYKLIHLINLDIILGDVILIPFESFEFIIYLLVKILLALWWCW